MNFYFVVLTELIVGNSVFPFIFFLACENRAFHPIRTHAEF